MFCTSLNSFNKNRIVFFSQMLPCGSSFVGFVCIFLVVLLVFYCCILICVKVLNYLGDNGVGSRSSLHGNDQVGGWPLLMDQAEGEVH